MTVVRYNQRNSKGQALLKIKALLIFCFANLYLERAFALSKRRFLAERDIVYKRSYPSYLANRIKLSALYVINALIVTANIMVTIITLFILYLFDSLSISKDALRMLFFLTAKRCFGPSDIVRYKPGFSPFSVMRSMISILYFRENRSSKSCIA